MIINPNRLVFLANSFKDSDPTFSYSANFFGKRVFLVIKSIARLI